MKTFYVSALIFLSLFFPRAYAVTPKIALEATHNVAPTESLTQPKKTTTRAVSSPKAYVIPEETSSIYAYVASQAQKVGINPKLATCIVQHESQFIVDKVGPEKGGWVSQGLWQIYQKAWPDITKAEADNMVWSTNWALTQIKNGHVNWWSTYSAKPFYCKSLQVMIN